VIAAIKHPFDRTDERGHTVLKHGRASQVGEAQLERGIGAPGEMAREGLLVRAQDIYGETLRFDDDRGHTRPPVHAYQEQQRLQRDGGDGVGRHAAGLLAGLRGDHGNPGGKQTHGGTVFALINTHWLGSLSISMFRSFLIMRQFWDFVARGAQAKRGNQVSPSPCLPGAKGAGKPGCSALLVGVGRPSQV
jgi:hypothetical protein